MNIVNSIWGQKDYKFLNAFLDLLAEIGMPSAFGAEADFSGIDGTKELFISEVVHKAFVAVDEAGTNSSKWGEASSPDSVSAWAGRYFFGAGLGEFDDCLILAGPFGVRYGLEAANETVKAALEDLRKIDKLVGPVPDIRIWGEMECGVSDVNGCRILVEHLEELFSR